MNYRMFPSAVVPGGVVGVAHVVNGKQYLGTPGQFAVIPSADGKLLEGNGWWLRMRGPGLTGPTSARPGPGFPTADNPEPATAGSIYFDSSLGITIFFDGVSWRSPLDASLV